MKTHTPSRVSILIGITVLFGMALNTQASVVAWTGATDNDWNTGSNWDTGVVPTSSDLANLGSASTINVSSAVSVGGITSSSGTKTLTGEQITLSNDPIALITVLTSSLEINNDLVIAQNNKNIDTKFGGSLTINGSLITDNNVTIRNGTAGSLNTITINGNRTGGGASTFLTGSVGDINATGILAHNGGGILRVSGSGTIVSARTGGPSIETGSAGLWASPGGTFEFGANDQIGDPTLVYMNGGTIDLAGFSNATTINNMELNGDSFFDFSDPAAESIVFGDMSSVTWGSSASLTIVGFGVGDSLRFGTTSGGLTSTQLSQINFDGNSALIDSSGFVTGTVIPEPSTIVLLGQGLGALALLRRWRIRPYIEP